MTEYSFNENEAPLSKVTIKGCGKSHTEKLEDHPESETLKCVLSEGVFVFKVVRGKDRLLYHVYGTCGNNMHDTVGMEKHFQWADGDWLVHCI